MPISENVYGSRADNSYRIAKKMLSAELRRTSRDKRIGVIERMHKRRIGLCLRTEAIFSGKDPFVMGFHGFSSENVACLQIRLAGPEVSMSVLNLSALDRKAIADVVIGRKFLQFQASLDEDGPGTQEGIRAYRLLYMECLENLYEQVVQGHEFSEYDDNFLLLDDREEEDEEEL